MQNSWHRHVATRAWMLSASPGCSASARTRSDVFAPCPGPGRPVTEKPPGLRQRGGHGAGEPWLARGNTTGKEERENNAK